VRFHILDCVTMLAWFRKLLNLEWANCAHLIWMAFRAWNLLNDVSRCGEQKLNGAMSQWVHARMYIVSNTMMMLMWSSTNFTSHASTWHALTIESDSQKVLVGRSHHLIGDLASARVFVSQGSFRMPAILILLRGLTCSILDTNLLAPLLISVQ